MTTDIIPFDHKGQAELPAHLAAAFGENDNIVARQTINQLSYRGKVFRRVVDGEETIVTKTDPDTQDKVPVQIIQIVILDHNKNRSRAYYEGAYEEGKNAAPLCFSGDGVKPDASVKDPCAPTCATCPKSVKGSKITEAGKQATACAPYKRMAVVPAGLLLKGGHVPLLLRIAQTSVWDANNPEESQGWYAWDQYVDMLRARGVKHTAMVETRMKFDATTAYPKLRFSAARYLAQDEVAAVVKQIDTDKAAIEGILFGKQSEDGMTGIPAAGTPASAPAADPKPATPDPAVAAAAAEAVKKEADAKAAAAIVEQRRKLEEQLAALSTPTAAPAVTETVQAAAPTPAAEPKPAAAAAPVVESGTPNGLKALMDDWDA